MILNSLACFLGIILCLGAFSNLFASAQTGCLTDFVLLRDRCYFVSNFILPFEEARDHCTSYSSGSYNYDLLTINHYEEFALITSQLQVIGFVGATVGAYRETNTSDWYWVDRTPLMLDDNLWDCNLLFNSSYNTAYIVLIDEPNCYNFGTFRLRTEPSNISNYFVCEGPALSASNISTSPELYCPTDFTLLKDRCYFFSNDFSLYLDFDEARNYCNSSSFESYDYDLLIISDNDEFALITSQLQMKGSFALVGAYRETDRSDWLWVNGSSLMVDLWDCNIISDYKVAYLSYVKSQELDCYYFNTFRLRGTFSAIEISFICEGPALPVE